MIEKNLYIAILLILSLSFQECFFFLCPSKKLKLKDSFYAIRLKSTCNFFDLGTICQFPIEIILINAFNEICCNVIFIRHLLVHSQGLWEHINLLKEIF